MREISDQLECEKQRERKRKKERENERKEQREEAWQTLDFIGSFRRTRYPVSVDQEENMTTNVAISLNQTLLSPIKYYNKFRIIHGILTRITLPYIFIVGFVGLITNLFTILLLSTSCITKNLKHKWTLISLGQYTKLGVFLGYERGIKRSLTQENSESREFRKLMRSR